jgi:large subunit ribosomal protein L25
MSNSNLKLKALLRGPGVKRTAELIPAILYGFKTDNITLSVDKKEFDKAFQQGGESTLMDLDIDGKSITVLVHDIQKDTVSGDIIHIDFYKPDLEKKVNVVIPLQTEGDPSAVKTYGGTLVKHINDLEVKALPNNIPNEIIVNVEGLEDIGSSIAIRDIVLPEGVEILRDPEEIVIIIAAPTNVEEELEKPIEEKVDDVEAIGEKKEEEGEGEETKETTEE